ncbi:tetratricopeptide repeat protein [Algivirga pacifica]|uniref:Tetratricopeptide repeat-containing protein n=1 Tax=Algivirga pacifica TaxID=1162670 RepID=A0ABP9D072_9BACT
MNMIIKHIGLLLLLTFLGLQGFGQSNIEDLVKEGVQYHDNGDYEKAIATYKKALEIDPKSALVNYEMALSYFKKGDYKEVIKYSDVVLKQKESYMLQAYMTKGSALDLLGKTKKSIKLFEKAIKNIGGHYLLYYNLALNYYKMNNFDMAEENVIKAIETNSSHASSHLMLANIHNLRGHSVQALLATYYFLFLEAGTQRSAAALEMLQDNFGRNVSENESNPNAVDIMLSLNNTSQFGAAELMVLMLEASKSLEENRDKSEDQLFVENTGSFFTMLGELRKEEDQEIWWTLYTAFFYDLAQSEHLETYCKYITQSSNENSRKWLLENNSKLEDFDNWLQN